MKYALCNLARHEDPAAAGHMLPRAHFTINTEPRAEKAISRKMMLPCKEPEATAVAMVAHTWHRQLALSTKV